MPAFGHEEDAFYCRTTVGSYAVWKHFDPAVTEIPVLKVP